MDVIINIPLFCLILQKKENQSKVFGICILYIFNQHQKILNSIEEKISKLIEGSQCQCYLNESKLTRLTVFTKKYIF